jgi:hypothetical protein
MCRHLLGTEGEDHVRVLTGHGLECDLCCPAYDRAARDGSPPELLLACEGCVARCIDEGWGPVAWRTALREEENRSARRGRFPTCVIKQLA